MVFFSGLAKFPMRIEFPDPGFRCFGKSAAFEADTLNLKRGKLVQPFDSSATFSADRLQCRPPSLPVARFSGESGEVSQGSSSICLKATVDGRNPKQPPGMYETLQIMGDLPYQLVSGISSINRCAEVKSSWLTLSNGHHKRRLQYALRVGSPKKTCRRFLSLGKACLMPEHRNSERLFGKYHQKGCPETT